MTNTTEPKTEPKPTHVIYTRHTGPRQYDRKEGTFIITRNHRIKIAEKPDEIIAGDKPVVPAQLAADIVEAGHGKYYTASAAAPEKKDDKAEEPKKEG